MQWCTTAVDAGSTQLGKYERLFPCGIGYVMSFVSRVTHASRAMIILPRNRASNRRETLKAGAGCDTRPILSRIDAVRYRADQRQHHLPPSIATSVQHNREAENGG